MILTLPAVGQNPKPLNAEELCKGMPKDVIQYIMSRAACISLGSEYGGSKEQDEHLDKQYEILECSKLKTNKTRLLNKYAKRAIIIYRINQADNIEP